MTTAAEPSADLAPEAGALPGKPAKPSILLPLIIGSALFMGTLDSTAIANALPTMARSLHQPPLILNLAITAYLLSTAVFLPVSGWIADRYGAKTVFQCAMVGFAVSSLFCGLSQTLPQIVLARILQGMAGAMMAPVGRLVLLRSVPKAQMVHAMALLTMPVLTGQVLGPPVGGFIVTFLSWRWIFFVNLPISLVCVALTGLFMPPVREEAGRRLDVRGFALSGVALAGLVFGLENVGRDALPPVMIGLLLVTGGGAGWLYWLHFRRCPAPILDLALLKIETFRSAVVGGLFSRIALGAQPFLLALLLQLGFGLSAFQAGLLSFAGAAGALAMRTSASPILARFGFKAVLTVNTLITAGLFASYALFRPSTPHAVIFVLLLIGGYFRSLQFTALSALTFADVPGSAMSDATSFSSVFQQLSQSLGVGSAALIIDLTLSLHKGRALGAGDITPAFWMIALLSLVNLLFVLPMPASAGREMSGHRPKDAALPEAAAR